MVFGTSGKLQTGKRTTGFEMVARRWKGLKGGGGEEGELWTYRIHQIPRNTPPMMLVVDRWHCQ